MLIVSGGAGKKVRPSGSCSMLKNEGYFLVFCCAKLMFVTQNKHIRSKTALLTKQEEQEITICFIYYIIK